LPEKLNLQSLFYLLVNKMAPPTYGDLGKNARDVFGKGYHFGLMKLELKSKTASGIEFVSGGTSNVDSGKVSGNLETKYKFKDHGLTFTEKWNTDNQVCKVSTTRRSRREEITFNCF